MNKTIQIGQLVYHQQVYNGKELLEVVGIRENEVELAGDYSGGTHPVFQKEWLPMQGIIIAKEECKNKVDGSCALHNIFCKHPDCEPLLFKNAHPGGKEGVVL